MYSMQFINFYQSHKKRKVSLETRVELAVIRTYVENQAILEPIIFYRVSKCKQTKEQGSEDCLWTHIFTIYKIIVSFFLSYVKMQTKQDQTVLQ